MAFIIAGASLFAVLLIILFAFIGIALLKKFKWRDCIVLLSFFVLAPFPFVIPLVVVLFLLLWLLPGQEVVGKRGISELAAILLTIVILAAALAGSTFTQFNNGTIEKNSGAVEALVISTTALSSASLYLNRSLRNYAANALISLLALWAYLWYFTTFNSLVAEDIQMGFFESAGFTLMAYLIMLALAIRAALSIHLVATAWRMNKSCCDNKRIT